MQTTVAANARFKQQILTCEETGTRPAQPSAVIRRRPWFSSSPKPFFALVSSNRTRRSGGGGNGGNEQTTRTRILVGAEVLYMLCTTPTMPFPLGLGTSNSSATSAFDCSNAFSGEPPQWPTTPKQPFCVGGCDNETSCSLEHRQSPHRVRKRVANEQLQST